MSKTPIRDALGMLVHEGFVTVQPRRGYRVSDITLADLVDALLKGNLNMAREIATSQIETSRKRVMEALLGEMSGPNGNFNASALKLGRRGRPS